MNKGLFTPRTITIKITIMISILASFEASNAQALLKSHIDSKWLSMVYHYCCSVDFPPYYPGIVIIHFIVILIAIVLGMNSVKTYTG